jgi:hypothetical protein
MGARQLTPSRSCYADPCGIDQTSTQVKLDSFGGLGGVSILRPDWIAREMIQDGEWTMAQLPLCHKCGFPG